MHLREELKNQMLNQMNLQELKDYYKKTLSKFDNVLDKIGQLRKTISAKEATTLLSADDFWYYLRSYFSNNHRFLWFVNIFPDHNLHLKDFKSLYQQNNSNIYNYEHQDLESMFQLLKELEREAKDIFFWLNESINELNTRFYEPEGGVLIPTYTFKERWEDHLLTEEWQAKDVVKRVRQTILSEQALRETLRRYLEERETAMQKMRDAVQKWLSVNESDQESRLDIEDDYYTEEEIIVELDSFILATAELINQPVEEIAGFTRYDAKKEFPPPWTKEKLEKIIRSSEEFIPLDEKQILENQKELNSPPTAAEIRQRYVGRDSLGRQKTLEGKVLRKNISDKQLMYLYLESVQKKRDRAVDSLDRHRKQLEEAKKELEAYQKRVNDAMAQAKDSQLSEANDEEAMDIDMPKPRRELDEGLATVTYRKNRLDALLQLIEDVLTQYHTLQQQSDVASPRPMKDILKKELLLKTVMPKLLMEFDMLVNQENAPRVIQDDAQRRRALRAIVGMNGKYIISSEGVRNAAPGYQALNQLKKEAENVVVVQELQKLLDSKDAFAIMRQWQKIQEYQRFLNRKSVEEWKYFRSAFAEEYNALKMLMQQYGLPNNLDEVTTLMTLGFSRNV